MAVGKWWREPSTRKWRRRSRLALALGVPSSLAAVSALTDGWPLGAAALLIGPVLSCVRLDARHTAAAAVWALLLALSAGSVRHPVWTPGFGLEFLVLLAGGGLAVRGAARHTADAVALARATEVAHAAQGAILRPISGTLGTIEVCTLHHCPAHGASVCGDLYDIVHTPYGARLLIGDVRGHSLDALRTTAAAIQAFRDLAYVTPGLADVAGGMDARLAPSLGPEDFVTAVLAEFAPGEVRIVNCGHPSPVRVGTRIRLLEPPEPALPLGLHPTPRPHRVFLQHGDRLLFYTDGLSEARDASGADFPLLERVGEALSAPSPADALAALFEMASAHTGCPPADDLALVLCQPADLADPARPALPSDLSAGEPPEPTGKAPEGRAGRLP